MGPAMEYCLATKDRMPLPPDVLARNREDVRRRLAASPFKDGEGFLRSLKAIQELTETSGEEQS